MYKKYLISKDFYESSNLWWTKITDWGMKYQNFILPKKLVF